MGWSHIYISGKVFDMIVHNDDSTHNSNDNTISNISSHPLQICNCEFNYPNCGYSYPTYTVYPGEMFQVFEGAVGKKKWNSS